MQYLRLLLLPFSFLYSLIIRLRNKAYDAGIFSSKKFSLPVICIGNLTVGGAGKSPMAEYLISLLKDKYKIAVLSRGYGRKTKGFRFVELDDTAAEAGDEPMQFRQKFKEITVAVSEKRVTGIEVLKSKHDVLILDDAFQHRAVSAGLNILLFDYTSLNDFFLMLPAGNFREPFSGRKRAQIIMITKTPEELSNEERNTLTVKIKPYPHQKLFFSYLDYGNLVPVFDYTVPGSLQLTARSPLQTAFLLTGIANPYPLAEKLKSAANEVKHYDYPDHHPFSKKNIAKLVSDFNASANKNKVIITTEKDAQRLKSPELKELLENLPVYYLPVKAKIHQPDEERFNNLIEEYAKRHLQHHRIY